jgi:gluconokinase
MSMAASRPAFENREPVMPTEPFAGPLAIVVMGVSGCGKSSVGERLAALRGVRFVEGDQLHPAANVAKMAQGIPLTDADRMPWLERIACEFKAALDAGEGVVLSCSSLKKSYRDVFRNAADGRLVFVFLEGTRDVLMTRMSARKGHFMPVSLLDDQLKVLEVPRGEPDVVTVNIDDPLERIVLLACKGLEELEKQGAGHGQ